MDNSAEAASANTIERPRWQERDIVEFVKEEPLTALAIAGPYDRTPLGHPQRRVGNLRGLADTAGTSSR
jgi:hypothetical protein